MPLFALIVFAADQLVLTSHHGLKKSRECHCLL